jgi:type II secretory ATPase GspE/PulE/Tfp pilus assembly ATPase PilB-like protein
MSQDARRDEELNTERRARILSLEYFDTSTIPLEQKQLYSDILSPKEIIDLRVVPVKATEHSVIFGVTNTTSQQTMTNLRNRFLDQKVSFALISDNGYKDYVNLYNPPEQVVYHDISVNNTDNETSIQSVSAVLEQVKASDMLAYLVRQAHKLNSSDIHVETQRDFVRIRFRIDGVLHPIARLSIEKYRVLISAIASSGNVSTSTSEPQQGHISQHITMEDGNKVDINLRLETVPTVNGMDVVMRLFNMNAEMYNLDRLKLSKSERDIVDEIISKPSGLVMVVGPTGSGKTTTLYSMLNSLNTEERKIITVEDPVEYQFPGITQMSVTVQGKTESGSFADRLKAILRLDPDIVMVGEIRDLDTAKTALQASLTGHLVLSTFHASSASAALTRIMDVVGENPLFVSAIRLVMAQRLVRCLDDSTKQPYVPDETTKSRIREVLNSLPDNIEKPNLENITLYKPGSSAENPFGYKGQVPVREQFIMAGEVRQLLESGQKNISAQQIEAAAIKSGMKTMLQDGILKVCAGQTTLEEVYRVIG